MVCCGTRWCTTRGATVRSTARACRWVGERTGRSISAPTRSRVSRGDNTERVLIENNVFQDVTAEGADLKEGTDSGILRGNTFIRAGNSGQNSADSAVDAKGNNWVIENNSVSDSMAPWNDDGVMRPTEFLDGFQSHSVYSGYGTGNVFRGNRVVGANPGVRDRAVSLSS